MSELFCTQSECLEELDLGVTSFLNTARSNSPQILQKSTLELFQPMKKEVGRKKNSETSILSSFITLSGRNLKKEYLRCRLIRGHKRMCRQIISGKNPSKYLKKLKLEVTTASNLWKKLQKICQKNPSLFKNISQTQAGPLTDGKKKRTQKVTHVPSSFNNDFCVLYFQDNLMRKSFFVYIELLFSDPQPDVLKEKFGASCCYGVQHTMLCTDKWMELKEYVQVKMLQEIGCGFINFKAQRG